MEEMRTDTRGAAGCLGLGSGPSNLWRVGLDLGVEMSAQCSHLDTILKHLKLGKTRGCEECLKLGQSWVHLRLCTECGHVGCCDSSIGKHATRHFHAVRHPLVQSLEPGEQWYWCYVDEVMFELG